MVVSVGRGISSDPEKGIALAEELAGACLLYTSMMKGRYGYRMGYPMGKSELVDNMVNDALWDATGCNMHMGMTRCV